MEQFVEDGEVKLLLVKVKKSVASGIDLYDATRGVWRVNVEKARQAGIVLGVSDGVVISAFVPTHWKPATRDEFPFHPGEMEGRFAFDGRLAVASIAAKYVGRLLPDRLAAKRGAANPVRYSW